MQTVAIWDAKQFTRLYKYAEEEVDAWYQEGAQIIRYDQRKDETDLEKELLQGSLCLFG